jgi:hypothetical protein
MSYEMMSMPVWCDFPTFLRLSLPHRLIVEAETVSEMLEIHTILTAGGPRRLHKE